MKKLSRMGARAFPLSLALVLAGCGGDPTATAPVCGSTPGLSPGEAVSATLGESDRRRGGAFVDYYSFQPTQTVQVRLRLTTDMFEPFLFLFDATGLVVAHAFDPAPGAGSASAELTHSLGPGCYLVGASSWGREGRGGYSVLLEVAEPLQSGGR